MDLTDMIDLIRTVDVKRLLDSNAHSTSGVTTVPDARRPGWRLVVGLALAAAGLGVATAAPAAATGGGTGGTSTTVFSTLRSGEQGTAVGNAAFKRTRSSSGQSLSVWLATGNGDENGGPDIKESHVCVSTDPFTGPVPPCQHNQGASGSQAVYGIDLGSTTGTVYVQAWIVTVDGVTAYAGWKTGSSGVYGNVAVADPGGSGTPVPVGAVGVLGLSGLVAGGVALRRGARR
jgi:hypothetical protein